MHRLKTLLILLTAVLLVQSLEAQVDTIPDVGDTTVVPTVEIPVLSDTTHFTDTVIRNTPEGKDTVVKKKVHSPKQATIRSAILPGLGQIYNRKYWKVPIVYAAVGIPVYLFFDNKKWYDRSRYALSIVANERYNNTDSMSRVHPQLLTLVNLKAESSIINYRNEFRKNMDYSVLITLLMWGLNVVDATVDAHLAGFNVSDDLALRLRPVMTTPTTPGIALVLNFK